ncbi:MAG: Gfo/Idh/MocA family oxidoreductase [Balneolaceae bacterium]
MSESVKTHTVGVIMNGVTGRMGTNQHLMRSILPIIRQGGVRISPTEVILPRPVLVGRNPVKLKKLCEQAGIDDWTTDLESVLEDDDYPVYFDAQRTDLRFESIKKAAAAGKHIYCEKPSAVTTEKAVELYRIAEKAGVKHGVVQDKLWLPGLVRLRQLKQQGFFGDILSVKADFGYWVFEGDSVAAQRPSWNYRKEDGGGMILDMFCHWRYVLDNLFGEVKSVSCLAATHIDKRYDEEGTPYQATADDAAYAIFQLDGGIIAQFNSSWATRVRRDDLLTMQVDGTKGSAVAGLREVWIQPYSATPKPVWNPDEDSDHNFRDDWIRMPAQQDFENAFKIQWELFLRHVIKDEPFRWNLLEAAKGNQLADIGYRASEQREWIDVPDLV